MAPAMPYLHIENVTAKAWFSTNRGLKYRYRLEITKVGASTSPKTACVVMQNPSYAGESVADKSVQFMEKNIFERGLLEFKGVERLIVVNQFARIQTTEFEGLPSDLGPKNNKAIETALMESDIVVIGWGSSNRFDARKEFVLGLLKRLPGKQLYQTKMHPSRGRYAGFILPLRLIGDADGT
jgi:hypothetical protein